MYFFEGDGVLIRAAVALLVEEEGLVLGAKSGGEVRELLMGGKQGRRGPVGEVGAEDRWMEGVRAAGRS